MADESLYSHVVEEQLTHLSQQIQVEKDSGKLIELVEDLNRLLEARENQLLARRAAKGR